MNKLDKERQLANREITAIIMEWVQAYPEMRFHQILAALDITDSPNPFFYEESTATLQGIKHFALMPGNT